jgi:hypothetical protein
MRTEKPYTNTTFTKRVDHEAGRHRPARSAAEPVWCAGCGAVYVKRRWSQALPSHLRAARAGRPIHVRLCPGCRTRRDGSPRGFVHVDGEFLRTHLADVERLLRKEVARAAEDNPTSQVVQWGQAGAAGLLVSTTTEHLAVRLGRALEKAYDGTVRYGFSHEDKLAHVWWARD